MYFSADDAADADADDDSVILALFFLALLASFVFFPRDSCGDDDGNGLVVCFPMIFVLGRSMIL